MPKNIILLSDGTGNSAANPFKTNVWRLYQAIDITSSPGQQLAHYHDGVGTGTFRPLVLLGLALGVGLARGVKDLYTFACRNYQPGDNIYLFGFSRGAFTARILSGLILRCGLVTAPDEDELKERVKFAYAEYKRDAARRATATRPGLIAGHRLGGSRLGGATDHIEFGFDQHFTRIRFIGVWDTVDAYGVPIDELKVGIDRYIWPMSLADRHLSAYIDRACHALSFDDERPTFRPVLWTDPPTDHDQLTQLWFPGVHANVGGGYPDDALALVPLQWMMDEAKAAGLGIDPVKEAEYNSRANMHGPQFDSRAGLGGYYRYGPRDVDALASDREHGVSVRRVQIHADAVRRIREWQVAYSPVSFPMRSPDTVAAPGEPCYELLERGGGRVPIAHVPATESAAMVDQRREDMESVRDAIFRRRVAHLATVAFTLVLLLMPLVDRLTAASRWASAWRTPWTSHLPGLGGAMIWVRRMLRWIVEERLTPAWASIWLESFARHPALFLTSAGLVLWLFVRKSAQIQDQIAACAEYALRNI